MYARSLFLLATRFFIKFFLCVKKNLQKKEFMGKTFCTCLILLNLFLGAALFANANHLIGQYIDGKFYVAPGTVHVAPNGIFLNLEGNFLPVEAVCTDDRGVYCLFPSCSSKMRDWKCPREGCGTWNGAWRIRCQRCDYPRPAGAIDD